jgi:hypothetical protein
MRMRRLLPVLGLVATTLCSCLAGPQQLRRSVDDWDHALYVQNPWLDAGLWVVPVIPIASLAGGLVDCLVVNPIFVWGSDAWDCNGTGFKHHDPVPDTWCDSVLLERGRWLRTEKHDDDGK